MALLVTGVAGFIGSNFVHLMLDQNPDLSIVGLDSFTYAADQENLEGVDRERFKLIKGDITNEELVDHIFYEHDITGVINFAAESHVDRSIEDPMIFLKSNVLGVGTLLNVALKHWRTVGGYRDGVRFLQISTDEVYGSLGETGLFTETTPLDPRSPYSASKASADHLVLAYNHTYGLPAVITRCSNNYGPRQDFEKLIPKVIANSLDHKSIPVYGDGRQIRDWLYVDDHCRAIDLVFRNGKDGEVYNVGGNNEKMNINLVKTIIRLLSEKTGDGEINDGLISFVEDRLGHDRRYGIDPTKIQTELGWKSEVTFEEGMSRTIDWYLKKLQKR